MTGLDDGLFYSQILINFKTEHIRHQVVLYSALQFLVSTTLKQVNFVFHSPIAGRPYSISSYAGLSKKKEACH